MRSINSSVNYLLFLSLKNLYLSDFLYRKTLISISQLSMFSNDDSESEIFGNVIVIVVKTYFCGLYRKRSKYLTVKIQ